MIYHFAIWNIIVWHTLLDIVNGQSATITTSFASQCYRSLVPTSFTTTISAQAQAEALASPCPIYGGSMAIFKDTADLVFTGLEAINGDIYMDNLSATITVSFPNLQAARAVIWMLRSSQSRILFDNLTSVRDLVIDDWTFPTSTGTSFGILERLSRGLITVTQRVFVRNTNLVDVNLPATNPPLEVAAIHGNAHLRSVKLNGTIAGSFNMANNTHVTQGEVLSVDISGMTTNGDIVIENNQNISLSDLGGVGGDLRIRNNTGLQAIALDSLPTLKGSLQVSDNLDLTRLSMRKLVSAQRNLQITDNNRLLSAGDMPSLSVIGGSLSLRGPFDSISWASKLKSVGGSVAVDSSRNLRCDSLDTLLTKGSMGESVVQSSAFSCRSTNQTIQSDNPSTTTTSSNNGAGSGFSIGTVVGITIAVVVACVITVVAIYCCWRRRRRQRKTALEAKHLEDERQSPESEPFSVSDQRSIQEIWSDPASELATKMHHSELPTKERPAELPIKQNHAKISVKQHRSSTKKKSRVMVQDTPYELPG